MYEERIADFVFQAIDQQSIDPLVAWLKTLGCEVIADCGDGAINLKGIAGMNAALILADPNTMAVQVGFLLANVYWPHAYPRLQKVINKRWGDRRKAEQMEEEECQATS